MASGFFVGSLWTVRKCLGSYWTGKIIGFGLDDANWNNNIEMLKGRLIGKDFLCEENLDYHESKEDMMLLRNL